MVDTQQGFPQVPQKMVDTITGQVTQPWYQFFLSLWNRTGGSQGALPGTGTVTSVSVISNNGITESVTNPTTTPSITLGLGAITPSSVAATGTVTGSNISGTNTGDVTLAGQDYLTITAQVITAHTIDSDDITAGAAATNVGTLGGDLSGTLPNPTVAKLQGYAVKNIAPTDGQLLTWVNGSSDWEPKTLSNVALLNAANTFTVAPQQITIDAAAHQGLVVKGAGSQSADLVHFQDSGNNALSGVDSSGNFITEAAGIGIKIQEGTNARMGLAMLSSGAVTVSNTSVTANTRIFLTINAGTIANAGAVYVSDIIPGTSFIITSTNASDSSSVAWVLIEPSPVTYPAAGLPTRSIQFAAASNQYFSMSNANWGFSSVNRSLFALSFWYRRASTGAGMYVFDFTNGNGAGSYNILFDGSDHIELRSSKDGASYDGTYITTATYTDTASWHNVLAYFDFNNPTSSQRMRLWHDGIEVTTFSTSTAPTGAIYNNPEGPVTWAAFYNADTVSISSPFDGKIFQPTFYNGFLPTIGSVYSAGHPVDVSTMGPFSLLNTNATDAITKDYVIATAWTNNNTATKSTDIPT